MHKLLLFLSLFFLQANAQNKTIGSIERIDPAFDAIMNFDAKAEIIAEGFEWSEGPLWIEKEKMLIFSDVLTNTMYKWTETKGKEVYLTPSGYTSKTPRGGETGSNGLLLNKKGQLLLCQHGNRQIALMNAPIENPQPLFTTVAGSFHSKKFNSPNDAVYRSNGDIFFTDPPYGLEKNVDDPLKEISYQGVYMVKANGEVKLLTDSITRPNGIAFMPGEKILIIANSDASKPYWYEYDLDENDNLIHPRIFYDPSKTAKNETGVPDGLKIDKNGNVFATGPGGVWIFNKDGKVLGRIKIPVATSNCAFSPDEKTLYVTADMYVLRVKMR